MYVLERVVVVWHGSRVRAQGVRIQNIRHIRVGAGGGGVARLKAQGSDIQKKLIFLNFHELIKISSCPINGDY